MGPSLTISQRCCESRARSGWCLEEFRTGTFAGFCNRTCGFCHESYSGDFPGIGGQDLRETAISVNHNLVVSKLAIFIFGLCAIIATLISSLPEWSRVIILSLHII